jgi:phosphoglycolate phosphatase
VNQLRHIIWDWNGTLLNDAWLCVDILNGMLSKRGKPLTDLDQYQSEFFFPVESYYRNLGFDFDQESFREITDEYMIQYDTRRFECHLQTGTREVISDLTSQGYTQSILSACEQSRLDEIVQFTGLKRYFQQVVGIDDCFAVSKLDHGKQLIRELGCTSIDTVLIGDTLHDHEVAIALDIPCILIPSGHCSDKRFINCGAIVIGTVVEVLTLVVKL